MNDQSRQVAPIRIDITVEICNDCGGLVGWQMFRAGCCPGGVVCKHEKGTRFVTWPPPLAGFNS